MKVRSKMRVAILLSVALCCGGASAQTPAPSPGKPSPPPRAGRAGERVPPAPQVVTIIHRLNGLKMFRLLARSQEQVQAISSLDWSFNLMDDVHTNVIAGLALDDGETIAAWLPEAEVEFGPPDMVAIAPRPPKPPRAPDITVIGPEGKRLAARYVGLDAATGLSILRLVNKNTVS